MNAQSGAYAARKAKFTEKQEEVQRYYDTQGNTWLGQLLNTMSKVASANFDRDNNAQYRNDMYKVFNDFTADPNLARAAATDKHFSACLSFAHMFGFFVEEINARADEGTSVLFRPATVQSLNDPNRPSSSAHSRIISMAVPRRAAGSNRNDPFFTFNISPLSDGTQSTQSAPKRKAGSTTTTPSTKRTIAVKQKEEVLALDSVTPVARARRPTRVMMPTPSPTTNPSKVTKIPSKRRESGRAAAGADSPVKVDEECAECGTKVKASGLRRHMQRHAREKEPDHSMDSSLLDEEDCLEQEDKEPVAKKQMLMKKEFGLEMDDADEGAATEESPAARATKAVLDEWADNLLYKAATCFECKKECINYHQLSNHICHNHKGAAQSNYIFECLGCNKQFRSYRGAMGHVEHKIRTNEFICKNKIAYLWDEENDVTEEVGENNDAATEEGEGEPLATDSPMTKNDVATKEGEEGEGEQLCAIDSPMHDNEVEFEAEDQLSPSL